MGRGLLASEGPSPIADIAPSTRRGRGEALDYARGRYRALTRILGVERVVVTRRTVNSLVVELQELEVLDRRREQTHADLWLVL